MSTVVEGDPDPWNMRTYTWMEWGIFVMIEVILSLVCLSCGICGYHNVIKNKVYWADDIEDVDEDKQFGLSITPRMTHMSMTLSRMFTRQPSHISKTVVVEDEGSDHDPEISMEPVPEQLVQ
eukprot:373134_1